MKNLAIGLMAVVFFALSGCAAVYTSIEEVAEGTYHVTKIRKGFWRVAGSVYACTDAGDDTLECTLIEEP